MSNLLATLTVASNALGAYNQVLNVVQNNVANASTPGYAKQTQILEPTKFDPWQGLAGGVALGRIISSRNEYAEQAVQQQTTILGQAQQDVNSLSALQSQFDITGNSGISAALNQLFSAFSAWAQTPTSSVAQQNVVEGATSAAAAFRQTAAGLNTIAQNTGVQLKQTVDAVNQMAGQLASYNHQIMNGARNDAGLDAEIHSTLEELSNHSAITVSQQSDGTWMVLLNGQTPLVIQDHVYALQVQPAANDPAAANPLGPAHWKLAAADGTDITPDTTTGQLGSLLNLANVVMPGYLGDQNQAGSLNLLATSFARTINNLLTAGYQSDGPPPVPGIPLFSFGSPNPTAAAQSLTINPAITASQLAAISPGPPEVSNGTALALSQLSSAAQLNGLSYTQYFAAMASHTGALLNDAESVLGAQQSAVAQAQNVRQQLSGVSLDQEATILMQFQQAYEANSKLITLLNQLAEDTLNMLQP